MNNYISMSADDRRSYCEEAAGKLRLPAPSIEKDFWVCWTLRELFTLPEWGQHLTFKGGTSLAKAWKLIERFSEDIDLVIGRDFLGFDGENSPDHAPSKKQQKKRLDDLKTVCRQRIRELLQPSFLDLLVERLPKGLSWKLERDDNDPDDQTLLFKYPAAFPGASYIQPVVKIELGARSDTEPSAAQNIQPYLAEAFPDILHSGAFTVQTVSAERTFWEKAMLLHEETYRPPGKPRKARLARHYYDLWCLITKGVSVRAIANSGLFDRVAAHRAIFFNWTWMDYSTLRPGALRIVPLDHQIKEWRLDYDSMRREMFFGEVPSFEEVLRVVGEFERRFNEKQSTPRISARHIEKMPLGGKE